MQQPVVETAVLGSIAATDFSSVAGLGEPAAACTSTASQGFVYHEFTATL